MIVKNYKLIHEISKSLKMNKGKGWTERYVKAVLSENEDRHNEEIEIIATVLNEAVVATKEQLVKNFDAYKNGKAHWIRVCAKKLNENQEAA